MTRTAGMTLFSKPVATLLISALITAGCSSYRASNMNPVNWFGKSSGPADTSIETPIQTGAANPLIPERRASILFTEKDESYQGVLVRDIADMHIERRPGGAIIRATGLVTYPGVFEVRLMPNESATNGSVLSYDMRSLFTGAGPAPTTTAARSVTAAIYLTDQDLEGIRTIRVISANNYRESNR